MHELSVEDLRTGSEDFLDIFRASQTRCSPDLCLSGELGRRMVSPSQPPTLSPPVGERRHPTALLVEGPGNPLVRTMS